MKENIDAWKDKSQKEWENWLNSELTKAENVYKEDPDRLISSFNREQSHIKDYHGRELLELIQNADDAGINFIGETKLKIKLLKNELYVTNTGIPFSTEGIKSLMVSDISPKEALGEKYIGYKGLGFRSILSWASSVAIISGNAKVGFSRSGANKWLSNLMESHESISTRVKSYADKTQKKMPVSVLDAPVCLNGSIDDKEFASLVKHGDAFISNDYNTSICISFQSEEIYNQIKKQINSIKSETLLFLQNISELNIETPKFEKSWNVERDENVVVITTGYNESNIWNLYSKNGEIPDELLDEEQIENKYEIKIAVPDQVSEFPGRIFAYFPTKEEFPFSVIAHATFELSANRQHINESEINQHISNELAFLMADAASKIVRPSDPWFALQSFVPQNDHISIALTEFDFLERLHDQLMTQKIVPNINCEFYSANDLFRLNGDFDNLLDIEYFPDITKYSDEDYLFKYLEIGQLSTDKFISRINIISDTLSVEERSQFIFTFCNNYKYQNIDTPPDLLIDINDNIIPGTVRTTFPAESQKFQLPGWVPVKILNAQLIGYLKELFDVEKTRDVRHKLGLFGVQEYNLTTIVSNIIAASNNRIKKHSEQESELRKELINALWVLYCSLDNPGNFQERITVPLQTRNGGVKDADSLYFGKEYDCGLLTDYLYQNIEADILLESPDKMGFDESNRKIEEFFKWLGVSDSPRVVKIPSLNDNDFIDYVKANVANPVKFSDITITKEKLQTERNWYFSLTDIQSTDHLEEILEHADHHAILTWIANCYEIENWRRAGDVNGEFCYTPIGHRKHRPLEENIPSYPIWLINTFPWMRTNSSTNKISPNTCSTTKIAKDLSPVIGYPAINMDHELFMKYEIDKTAITTALARSGVVADFDDVPWSTFYRILYQLPNIDPEAKKAKSLYRSLITRSNIDDQPPMGPEYDDFMCEGKMAGIKDGEIDYYPVVDLFYVENNTIPDHIAEHYPVVLLDRRRGAKKVNTLFGIEHLNTDVIQAEIIKHLLHPLSTQFNSDLDRLRPYVYALRIDADTNQGELKKIKRLNLKLCKSLRCTIVVNEEPISISIKPGKSLQQDDIAYLVTDKDHQSNLLKDELIASAVGEIITNQLKVDISGDIARLLSCKSSNRNELLNTILGGDGNEYLTRAKTLFETQDIDEESEFDWSNELDTENGQNSQGIETEDDNETDAEGEGFDTLDSNSDSISDVVVEEEEHTPSQSTTIPIAVVRKSGGKRKHSNQQRVDPDRAEELAFKFEEEQSRFPVLVSHLRGDLTPGCDILSFSTNQDQASFKSSIQDNINYFLVDRFIEVKGSSSATGSITLKGNELKRARQSKEKYFLYRIYEPNNCEFELVELSDPLDEDTKKLQYEINPFQCEKTQRWRVHEV
jgi:hypothetical protein